MNRIILIGRLTADPELRYTQNGIAVSSFTLAVDRPYSGKQGERETDFINIVTWRRQAETCANYLRKGRMAAVEGRLQIRSYETTDGQKRRVAEVVADRVEFIGGSTKSEEALQDFGKADEGFESMDFGDDINTDDIPF